MFKDVSRITVSMTVIVLLLTAGVLDASSETISFGIGDTIECNVSPSNYQDIASGSVSVNYGDCVTLTDAEWSVQGAVINHFDTEKDKGVFAFMHPSEIGAGNVLHLEFVATELGESKVTVSFRFIDSDENEYREDVEVTHIEVTDAGDDAGLNVWFVLLPIAIIAVFLLIAKFIGSNKEK